MVRFAATRTPPLAPIGSAPESATPARPARHRHAPGLRASEPGEIDHAAHDVAVQRGEPAGRERGALGQEGIDRAAESARRRLVAIGVADDHAVEQDEDFADVAAAHEEPRPLVDRRDARHRLERAHEIRLRPRHADHVERAEREARLDGRRRPRRAHGDDGLDVRDLQRDRQRTGRGRHDFARREPGERDQEPRAGGSGQVEFAAVVRDRERLAALDRHRRAREREARRVRDPPVHDGRVRPDRAPRTRPCTTVASLT